MRLQLFPCMRTSLFVILIWFSCVPSVSACSLCGNLLNRQTLRQELKQAKMVLFGTMVNPRPNKDSNISATGFTDIQIQYVLKGKQLLAGKNRLTVPRYIPIPDNKKPPQYLVFYNIINGELYPVMGRPADTVALVRYLAEFEKLNTKNRIEQLLFFFPYISSPDKIVADDAFLEFAKASDEEIGKVAKLLKPEPIRNLLKHPQTSADYRSLLAFLLGCCGNDADARWMRSIIVDPKASLAQNSLDGFLSGYVQQNPKDGWQLVNHIIRDDKRSDYDRFNAFYVVRFYQNWKTNPFRKEIVQTLSTALGEPDMADLAIDALRRYEITDLSDQVIALYNNPKFSAPVIRRSVIRYALYREGDTVSARTFLRQLRKTDPQLIAELEELVRIEKEFSNSKY